MKRLIFFLILAAGIAGSTYFILFDSSGGMVGETGFDYLKQVFELVKDGNWPWSDFNFMTVFTYGLVAFAFINAVLLLALAVMAMTTFFNFSKVYRFYATAWWFLFSAILFTGAVIYMPIDTGADIMDFVKDLPWQYYVPIASSLALVIISIIFKRSERN